MTKQTNISTSDLLVRKAQRFPEGDIADPHLAPIKILSCTRKPGKHAQGSTLIKSRYNTIMRGFTQGFQVGFDYSCELKGAKKNMHSANQHLMVVDNNLQDELKTGRA